jgi:hypothetical protein
MPLGGCGELATGDKPPVFTDSPLRLVSSAAAGWRRDNSRAGISASIPDGTIAAITSGTPVAAAMPTADHVSHHEADHTAER